MTPYRFDCLDDAIAALAEPLMPVEVESQCRECVGRVLAEPIQADRDHPAADVSAMDGYAVAHRDGGTLSDLFRTDEIPVTAESVPGSPPPTFSADGVIRIFTGGIVPSGCDRVIQREHTIEKSPMPSLPLGAIQWRAEASGSTEGANIRRQGENLTVGAQALAAGIVIDSPQAAAMASFGVTMTSVHRRVRVAIITTGDELSGGPHVEAEVPSGPLPAWKIRNSNAPALAALLARRRYLDQPTLLHAGDDPAQLRQTLAHAIRGHDMVLLTGGVSMGDHDYVPEVVRQLGAETVFHKLPLRPGKPILGAIHAESPGDVATPIIGLPGNPVSATMGAVRFALPLIDKLAGLTRWQCAPPSVELDDVGQKTLPLIWLRAVRMTRPGRAELVIGKGSGDLVSLAASDGFIEMPPGANHSGPWPFFGW
ncbi:molybdopterin molybdotransferase MoeA [Allorhodopirellula heiligendammensis]|uniref:Molybdopterin molybdenumtransferase n=1 Tax=Allorhodopirellula heiligendammensis TaxID=2714739 RepID=A0A5C6BYE0_9BACT|nr:molybdopterin molybdotransferase MoeA [Allorhodopirellula heiligendammensis]TWU16481.1 Molybdopterin molybdenumtransferase [Allorhodopirellula heiligendammensis]